VSHYVLDGGKLVVAHAGLREEMHGRGSPAVREFCLYGETTGETDEFGLPVRYNWASEYRGKAMVVYGHTPVPEAEWLNNTVNIDTGTVFGGQAHRIALPGAGVRLSRGGYGIRDANPSLRAAPHRTRVPVSKCWTTCSI
jgi:protein phosphatase